MALVETEAEPRDDDDVADGDEDDQETEQGRDMPSERDRLLASENRYTADISDEQLAEMFVSESGALGSISVGYSGAGRLINGVQMPPGDAWIVVSPDAAYGTDVVIAAVQQAARAVQSQWPEAPLLRVNHISKADGGHLRPHRSHQSGRDVDLGLYYRAGVDPRAPQVAREEAMDPGPTWTLLRTLITQSDVKVILVDRRIQRKLHAYARDQGEDEAWLDRLFHAGPKSMFQHARRHRDHFHVRFYSPRAQELGRRIVPLLAKVPEQNLAVHRVRRGDTLSHLARRFNSSVKLIQARNGMRNTFLRAGQTLMIPLRGPCTRCPLPPPVEVPPRLLPPDMMTRGSAEATLAHTENLAPTSTDWRAVGAPAQPSDLSARRHVVTLPSSGGRPSVCLAP